MENAIEELKDPGTIIAEYEKAIRQEQNKAVTELQAELGRVKSQLTKAQQRLEKCELYEEISKKIDRRKTEQVLELTIEDTELLKLIETFAQQYSKDINTFILFLLSALFNSDKGRHALVYMMSQLRVQDE